MAAAIFLTFFQGPNSDIMLEVTDHWNAKNLFHAGVINRRPHREEA